MNHDIQWYVLAVTFVFSMKSDCPYLGWHIWLLDRLSSPVYFGTVARLRKESLQQTFITSFFPSFVCLSPCLFLSVFLSLSLRLSQAMYTWLYCAKTCKTEFHQICHTCYGLPYGHVLVQKSPDKASLSGMHLTMFMVHHNIMLPWWA